MRERFGLDSLAAHPLAQVRAALFDSENAFANLSAMCNKIEALFDPIEAALETTSAVLTKILILQAPLNWHEVALNCLSLSWWRI